MPEDQETTVLVVDDEEKLANMFTLWLRGDYDVRTVYEGEAFLAEVDEDVDVVLLDRRMPGYSGDDVLEMLGRRDADPAVIVVTAIDPELDVLEMPFDDYLVKPVQHDELVDAIELQMRAREHDADLQRFLRLDTKRRVLLTEHREMALSGRPEWESLIEEYDELRDRLQRTVDDFESVVEAYRSSHRGRT
ncbi:response regulator [Halorubellus sp. PRR65]|uniref:response regulator transcription factor n=1 Tax=Halorubellus sp. PRR65 TaxID=3098148 RepID=UPI002B262162|nr:response regulator [Halorubellus sp. PRR65]